MQIENSSNSSLNRAPIKKRDQNEFRSVDKKIGDSRAFKEELTFGVEIQEGRGITVTLPIRTVSEGNCFEHWKKKHARHKQQQRAVLLALGPHRDKLKLPCTVTLTRYAPRSLDEHDNLRMAGKFIVDSIASLLVEGKKAGRADDDKRITWKYDQVKSKEYFVKIQIEFS